MAHYVAKRLLTGMVALLFLITITFFLAHLMPGNPFDTGNVSAQVLATIEKEYGLGEPLPVQYACYMKSLSAGDLGMSIKKQGVSVNVLIARTIPITVKIGGLAFTTAVLGGVSAGVWQIMTRSKVQKSMLVVCQSIGTGVPNFVFGLLFMLFFGVTLKWFPIVGITSAANYVMPVAALAVYPACVIARMVSSAAEKELKQSYAWLLEAKGLSRVEMLVGHMWRPVFSQLLVYLGQLLAYLLTGSFVIENIFTIPGLGREFVNSISNRDYTVIMGLTIFMGAVVILIQIMIDVLHMLLDPRIRFGKGQER